MPAEDLSDKTVDRPFIDAKDNRFVVSFFTVFTKFLAKRTFRKVYLNNGYGRKVKNRSTLYFGNHNAWWDALTPLLLNQYVLKQHPRAVMEWEQVHRYPFFRRIGCFSIDRKDYRSALKSLRYGIEWLNNAPGRSLFLYPEGKITNPQLPDSQFETGIGWMASQLEEHVDLVPFIQHSHLMHHSKPELYLQLGSPVDRSGFKASSKKDITASLEAQIKTQQLLFVEKASAKEHDIPVLF
ncbi:MAG: lysophospholipid acyltransferase family protein [Balneolia bacterium]|nr:lysophospholipid acyltransferase family protein [Balneolia bacterium]